MNQSQTETEFDEDPQEVVEDLHNYSPDHIEYELFAVKTDRIVVGVHDSKHHLDTEISLNPIEPWRYTQIKRKAMDALAEELRVQIGEEFSKVPMVEADQ